MCWPQGDPLPLCIPRPTPECSPFVGRQRRLSRAEPQYAGLPATWAGLGRERLAQSTGSLAASRAGDYSLEHCVLGAAGSHHAPSVRTGCGCSEEKHPRTLPWAAGVGCLNHFSAPRTDLAPRPAEAPVQPWAWPTPLPSPRTVRGHAGCREHPKRGREHSQRLRFTISWLFLRSTPGCPWGGPALGGGIRRSRVR